MIDQLKPTLFFTFGGRAGRTRLIRALVLAAGCLAAAAGPVRAGDIVFSLSDKTNLGTAHQIWVLGFATGGDPKYLDSDGKWKPFPTPSGTIPCWRFPQDIAQIVFEQGNTVTSGRIYYFVAQDGYVLNSNNQQVTQCSPANNATGVFGSGIFTYSSNGTAVNQPADGKSPGELHIPPFNFSELSTSDFANSSPPYALTIDLSQVDSYAFPMNITMSSVTSPAPPRPENPKVIGNPINNAVTHQAIIDSYSTFVSGMSDAGKLAYQPLLTAEGDYSFIFNPGKFLSTRTNTHLNTWFNPAVDALWGHESHAASPKGDGLIVNLGFALPSGRSTLKGEVFTVNLWGDATKTAQVWRFTEITPTANDPNAYQVAILSPKSYDSLCGSSDLSLCSNPHGVGYQIMATDGIFATCPAPETAGTYLNALTNTATVIVGGTEGGQALLNAQSRDYITTGGGCASAYARVGFILSSALNRGVALADQSQCPGEEAWQCWSDQELWYPTGSNSRFMNDILVQNEYSRWIHTQSISGYPIFARPPTPLNSGGNTPPASGPPMGMVYGFASDENATPESKTTSKNVEVPSKFDGTLLFSDTPPTGTITFGPWGFCWACLPDAGGWRAILRNLNRPDKDQDGVPDSADNCPDVPNASQANHDADANGDVCDNDDDNDGVSDALDAFPHDPNEQFDTDGDGIGDQADTDDDADGVSDSQDNCPLIHNTNQADQDGDGIGDACDICWECLPNASGWRSQIYR